MLLLNSSIKVKLDFGPTNKINKIQRNPTIKKHGLDTESTTAKSENYINIGGPLQCSSLVLILHASRTPAFRPTKMSLGHCK